MVKAAVALVFVALLSIPASAQKGASYPVKVHVSASRIGYDCAVSRGNTACESVQQLTAVVDGVKYELESETILPRGVVALGDYQAKLLEDEQKPTHEFKRAYELMFPDGSTRKFRVIGQTE